MIQQFPGTSQHFQVERPARPASLLIAVKVMYAGAAARLILAILYLTTESDTRAAIAKKNPHMSASTLNTLAHGGVIVGAVVSLIGAVIFLGIARSCQKGKNRARVTATVLTAVAVLGTAYNLASPVAPVVPVFNVVLDLIGLTAVVLLWLPASSAYFRFFRRPQF